METPITLKLTIHGAQSLIKLMLDSCKANRSTNPHNAFTHSAGGEIEALEDILSLLGLFGDEFKEPAAQVAKKKLERKVPHYSSAQDKCNGDAHWAQSYIEIMASFGVEVVKFDDLMKDKQD